MKLKDILEIPEEELTDEMLDNIELEPLDIMTGSQLARGMIKIKVYHAVDIYGNNREYGFTPNYDLPLENVVDSKLDVIISKKKFNELIKASMEEVNEFVKNILNK